MNLIRTRKRDDTPDGEPVELAALADGTIDPARRAALEARIAASPELAARFAEQQQVLALVRRAAAETEAPASLRRRVEAQRRRPRRSSMLVFGGAATALAAAAIVVAILVSGTSSKGLRAALGPTALAPAAVGHATLAKTPSGWRIELRATGLPRLDNGRFYEAWLKNAAGVLVPIGTFNDGRKVTLWAGVSPKKGFTTLTVTRERADGDQASSGEKVLVGKVDMGG